MTVNLTTPFLVFAIAMALLILPARLFASSQVILDDARVQVTIVELAAGKDYNLKGARHGSIWIALDNVAAIAEAGANAHRKIHRGETHLLPTGQTAGFVCDSNGYTRLIVVNAKRAVPAITVNTETLSPGNELQDASDRNETLVVAISAVQLRDIRNLGDESAWIPSKPEVISMDSGNVRWIRPGIHHFRNLLRGASTFVTLEW